MEREASVAIANELNRRRFLALGFVIAGVLVAQAFQLVDGKQPVLMVGAR